MSPIIRDFAPGEIVQICTGPVEILRHSEGGTTVRPTARKERTVIGVEGDVKAKFSAPSTAYSISGATPVYPSN